LIQQCVGTKTEAKCRSFFLHVTQSSSPAAERLGAIAAGAERRVLAEGGNMTGGQAAELSQAERRANLLAATRRRMSRQQQQQQRE